MPHCPRSGPRAPPSEGHIHEERLRLSKITENCKAAVNQLNSAASSETVEVMLRSISTSCVRQQAELRHNNDKLGLAVRQLTSRADLVADKL